MEQNEKGMMPYLKSLASCLKRMMVAGYTEMFKKTAEGIISLNTSRIYRKDDIKVINSFRFEGRSGSDGKATMYVIETRDGLKGTMVDADGRRSDVDMNAFLQDINR